MSTSSHSLWPFRSPRLTPLRIGFAFAVALATDTLQVASGPAGWLLLDEILDVIAMVLISAAIGFHPLLLPTFVIKLIPVADWLPTWTGCTVAVVLLRKRAQSPPPVSQPAQVLPPELLPPAQQPPPLNPKESTGDSFTSPHPH